MINVPHRGPKPKLPSDLRPLESDEKYCPSCQQIKIKTKDFYKQTYYDTYFTECKECNSKRGTARTKRLKPSLREQIRMLEKRIEALEQRIS